MCSGVNLQLVHEPIKSTVQVCSSLIENSLKLCCVPAVHVDYSYGYGEC